MRVSVISVLFGLGFAAILLPSRASAEVIYLKNGRTIWADHAEQIGAHVNYEIGEQSYSISALSVQRIEAGGVAPQRDSQSTSSIPMPTFAPTDSGIDSSLEGQIIHGGTVDNDALRALELQGNSTKTAAAYYLAGKYEFGQGNYGKSRSDFDRALHFDSDNPAILNYYAALLVRTGNASEALPMAERAVHYAPNSPDALAVLGYAQFASDHNQAALLAWKRSLALRPDATLEKYVHKAEKESSVEADYSERESSHFTLRYEGNKTSEALRAELLSTLESEYADLVSVLGIAPRTTIPVILYTNQAFFEATDAPSWSGALNDGKLRIPVQGITTITPSMARVLKHELAHSFINQLSGGRCPQWLNEGIAQAVEPKTLATNGPRLAHLFSTQHEIPFNSLEGSFMRFSPMEAALAYDESLAAVQYIDQTYGMSDLQRVLARLGEGSSTEAALRATIHSDYGQLEDEVGKYLATTYGK